jgi:hypothetical protein
MRAKLTAERTVNMPADITVCSGRATLEATAVADEVSIVGRHVEGV